MYQDEVSATNDKPTEAQADNNDTTDVYYRFGKAAMLKHRYKKIVPLLPEVLCP